ncbi:MAG: helix-turn-helix domain-containing protein, partial [Pseudomonadota bacterium]
NASGVYSVELTGLLLAHDWGLMCELVRKTPSLKKFRVPNQAKAFAFAVVGVWFLLPSFGLAAGGESCKEELNSAAAILETQASGEPEIESVHSGSEDPRAHHDGRADKNAGSLKMFSGTEPRFYWLENELRLSPNSRALLKALVENFPQPVTMDNLARLGFQPAQSAAFRLKEALSKQGVDDIEIVRIPKVGYRLVTKDSDPQHQLKFGELTFHKDSFQLFWRSGELKLISDWEKYALLLVLESPDSNLKRQALYKKMAMTGPMQKSTRVTINKIVDHFTDLDSRFQHIQVSETHIRWLDPKAVATMPPQQAVLEAPIELLPAVDLAGFSLRPSSMTVSRGDIEIVLERRMFRFLYLLFVYENVGLSLINQTLSSPVGPATLRDMAATVRAELAPLAPEFEIPIASQGKNQDITYSWFSKEGSDLKERFATQPPLSLGKVKINPESHEVEWRGKALHLTPLQTEVFYHLVREGSLNVEKFNLITGLNMSATSFRGHMAVIRPTLAEIDSLVPI